MPSSQIARTVARAMDRVYNRDLEAAQIKPGLCKPWRKMTPDEQKRWVNWTLDHFGGRPKMLKGADGKPTTHALAAKSYGLPIPESRADVTAILDLARSRQARL